jgi:hypothetical protein
MGVTGPEFTADLNELRIIGAIDLPTLGYTYATVNNAIAGTAGQDSAAFQISAGGSPSWIADIWPDLRNQLQNILGRTAENMQSTALTVLNIVDAFAATDEASATALTQAWKDGIPPGIVGGEHIPADQPPAVKIAQP